METLLLMGIGTLFIFFASYYLYLRLHPANEVNAQELRHRTQLEALSRMQRTQDNLQHSLGMLTVGLGVLFVLSLALVYLGT